jgi:hypothetical protein
MLHSLLLFITTIHYYYSYLSTRLSEIELSKVSSDANVSMEEY